MLQARPVPERQNAKVFNHLDATVRITPRLQDRPRAPGIPTSQYRHQACQPRPWTAALNVVALTQPPYRTSIPRSGRRPQHQKGGPAAIEYRFPLFADCVEKLGLVNSP